MVVKQLGMFAKFWGTGRVKTRLARDLGAERTSRLYRCFLETLVRRFAGEGDRRLLAYTPADSEEAFRELTSSAWTLAPQAAGDLGERMEDYFRRAFAADATYAILIGSDCPHLPLATVQQAFLELEQHSVVLGPSDDGGYYLVGAAREAPSIFTGIDWSTPAVWRQTIACLEAAGCDYTCLDPSYDIDDLNDLRRLRNELTLMEEAGRAEAWQRTLLAAVRAAWERDG